MTTEQEYLEFIKRINKALNYTLLSDEDIIRWNEMIELAEQEIKQRD